MQIWMINSQKQAFDSGICPIPFLYDHWKISAMCILMNYVASFIIYRQMRGEELEGLTVDELQQLEKSLESGLHKVLQTKVWWLSFFFASVWWLGLVLFLLGNMNHSFIGYIIAGSTILGTDQWAPTKGKEQLKGFTYCNVTYCNIYIHTHTC